jgi:hypothetical protein
MRKRFEQYNVRQTTDAKEKEREMTCGVGRSKRHRETYFARDWTDKHREFVLVVGGGADAVVTAAAAAEDRWVEMARQMHTCHNRAGEWTTHRHYHPVVARYCWSRSTVEPRFQRPLEQQPAGAVAANVRVGGAVASW